jgi:tRNA(Glu) U13 pseudouridine synthase TruD
VRLEDSRLVLEFFLPSGSYATEVLRELTAARTV